MNKRVADMTRTRTHTHTHTHTVSRRLFATAACDQLTERGLWWSCEWRLSYGGVAAWCVRREQAAEGDKEAEGERKVVMFVDSGMHQLTVCICAFTTEVTVGAMVMGTRCASQLPLRPLLPSFGFGHHATGLRRV